ncbi:DUF928 domain-containing protein [Geminocystis sp. CENA526]|uniref:DUF928 domain-containing protein n=1 Tax=Geminocystis sp. CENA526 TaxID=1355871 RepID=UPI003D6FA40C
MMRLTIQVLNKKPMLKPLILSSSVICFTCIFISSGKINVQAESLNFGNVNQITSHLIAQSQSRRLKFKLPDRGVPDARMGGAVRGGNKSIIAIIPPDKMPLASEKNSTIFVYIANNNSTEGNLRITDINGQELYRGKFIPPQETGIIRIKLPETIELKTNTPYRWDIELKSPNIHPTQAMRLRTFGWLEKVSLEEKVSSETDSQEDIWASLNTLAEEGIWYDTLNKLAVLRLENPEDEQIKSEWVELLNSVGLEKIAQTDIFSEVIITN